jgi:PhnB protein
MSGKWKPEGYNSVSAYLVCKQPEDVIGFVEAVFEGRLLRRFNRPDGSLMHCELLIDDTVVMLGGGQQGGDYEAHLHIYVADVDAVYARAMSFGAKSIQEPVRKTPEDDRRAGMRDACGNNWWIATQ